MTDTIESLKQKILEEFENKYVCYLNDDGEDDIHLIATPYEAKEFLTHAIEQAVTARDKEIDEGRKNSDLLACVMYKICEAAGFSSSLLGLLGSWGDTLEDDDILFQLEQFEVNFKESILDKLTTAKAEGVKEGEKKEQERMRRFIEDQGMFFYISFIELARVTGKWKDKEIVLLELNPDDLLSNPEGNT